MKPLLVLLLALCAAHADDQTATYRIVGLSAPERQDDWRQVIATIPEVQFVSVDFAKAEATLQFDVAKIFPDGKAPKGLTPETTLKQLNELFRKASRSTFTLTEPSTVPPDKLTELDLKIGILDCKGCRYGAYLAIAKLDGVERAAIDPAKNILSAWIDPAKTNRAALEEELKKARIELLAP